MKSTKDRMSIEEYKALMGSTSHRKNGAIKSFCYSRHHHPSKSEAAYCNWLLARKQNREIKSYSLYPSIELHVNGKIWRKWHIDFMVVENDGGKSYHEVKGYNFSDDRFRMKLAAFRLEYPEIPIYVNKQRILSKGWRREKDKNVKRFGSYLRQRGLRNLRKNGPACKPKSK